MSGSRAGQLEEAVIARGDGAGALHLQHPLQHTFSVSVSDATRVMMIPQYTDLTVPSGATMTCVPWNGSTGGVLWIKVAGKLQNDGTLDVTGKGFTGGAASAGATGR